MTESSIVSDLNMSPYLHTYLYVYIYTTVYIRIIRVDSLFQGLLCSLMPKSSLESSTLEVLILLAILILLSIHYSTNHSRFTDTWHCTYSCHSPLHYTVIVLFYVMSNVSQRLYLFNSYFCILWTICLLLLLTGLFKNIYLFRIGNHVPSIVLLPKVYVYWYIFKLGCWYVNIHFVYFLRACLLLKCWI